MADTAEFAVSLASWAIRRIAATFPGHGVPVACSSAAGLAGTVLLTELNGHLP